MPPPAECLVLASTLALGGGERVLTKYLETLRSQGLPFHLITLKEPGSVGRRLIAEGMAVESWRLTNTRDPRILLRLYRTMKKRRPAWVYIQDHHDCIFWGSLASALCGFLPVLIPIHSPGQRGASSLRAMNRLLLGFGQVLVLLGAWHHRALREEDRLSDGPRATIANPLDSERFFFKERPPRKLRVLGTVAALRPEKRHDLLLELFAELLQGRRAKLKIIGDGPERKKLETKAMALGIGRHIEFLGSREDIPEQLRSMDLFILTSDVEAQPLSLIEAMACGVPVAAPSRGGIPEILGYGSRGLILKGEDSIMWGRQILAYMDRLPSIRRREEIADRVGKEYGGGRFSDEYMRLITHIIDNV